MKATITIAIDTDSLNSVTDSYLAQLWHVAQANPADGFASGEPGALAEHIGREIIRRFLANTAPDLWNHKGHSFYWHQNLDAKEKLPAETMSRFAIWADEQPADSWRGCTASDMARAFATTLTLESGPHAIP